MARLANQAVFLTIEKVAHLGAGLVLLVVIARVLGKVVLGDYAFVIATTALFVPFLDAGLNNHAIKQVSQNQDWKSVSEAIWFRVQIGPWILGLMVGIAWMSDKPAHLIWAVILLGISTLAMSVGDAVNAGFKGWFRAQYSGILVGVTNILLVVASIWAITKGWDVVGVAMAYMLCRLGYGAASFRLLIQKVSEINFWQRANIQREVIFASIGFMPAVFFVGCLLHLNFLTADWLGNGVDSGFYAIGYRMASALFVLGGASLESVLAFFSTRSTADYQLWRRGWIILGGVGVVLVQWGSGPVTIWVFGEAFLPAVKCVKLLGWTLPPFLLLGFFHTILLARGQARKAFCFMLIFVAVGTVLGIAGFVFVGAEGTAFSPTITGWLFAGILGWMVRAEFRTG